LALRQAEPAIEGGRFKAFALSDTTLLLRQDADAGPSLLAVIQMNGDADVDLSNHAGVAGLETSRCQIILTTEDPPFAVDPMPPIVELGDHCPRIRFLRPSAILLAAWPNAT
jgi:hypothetical protein